MPRDNRPGELGEIAGLSVGAKINSLIGCIYESLTGNGGGSAGRTDDFAEPQMECDEAIGAELKLIIF